MSVIPDDELYRYADRVKGKVVVITGASNGIGKEAALQFAKHGAKVVIGDINVARGEQTVAEIVNAKGEAIFTRCDVCVWEDQLAMFEEAISTFGAVDIVVPNAGVAEVCEFETITLDSKGRPTKPQLTTIDINLIGVFYTCRLALHYIKLDQTTESLKAIVFIGSMASWTAFPRAPMYCASKHSILGLMRSLHLGNSVDGIRMACIHPWFADTEIVPVSGKMFLSGIPKTPVPRIAGAIFLAATDVDMETSGSAWLLPDDGPVFRVGKEDFKLGVYKMIDERRNSLLKGIRGIAQFVAVCRDLGRLMFGKRVLGLGLVIATIILAWIVRDVRV